MESWRILRPTAEYPERSNEWISEFLEPSLPKDNMYKATAKAMKELYEENGGVQPSFAMFNIKIQGDQGTSSAADDLGPQGAELVYFPTIWINFPVS